MLSSLVLALASTLIAVAPDFKPSLDVPAKARGFSLDTALVGGGSVVRASDHVDVLVVMQDEGKRLVGVTLLQNVIVLSNASPVPGEPRQLTLLVIPEEAQLLAVAKDAGRLSVTLRNPTDTGLLDNMDQATIQSTLQGKLVPPPKSSQK